MKIALPKTSLMLAASLALGLTQASAVSTVTMRLFDDASGGHYRANLNGELEGALGNYALGSSTDGTWFGTFCIERNEYFSNGGVYDAALDNGSTLGGETGASGGKDIISVGTAWLYEQFAIGALEGFSYGDYTNAWQLQNTIWELEGEHSGSNDFGIFMDMATSVDNWSSDYSGSAVKVMNLTRNGGTSHHQDQLIYVSNAVPDTGASVGLLALGIGALSIFRRRSNSRLDRS